MHQMILTIQSQLWFASKIPTINVVGEQFLWIGLINWQRLAALSTCQSIAMELDCKLFEVSFCNQIDF